MPIEVFNADARLDDRSSRVHEQGKAFQRPKLLELGKCRGIVAIKLAVSERRRILVKRDQHLLAVGRERMGEQRERMITPESFAHEIVFG